MKDFFEDWVGGIIGFLILTITIWGIVWSFYRHGPIHGVAATFFPPYGTFRGVAYFWEEPEWKENWDEKTETLGIILAMSNSEENSIEIIKYKDQLRKWINKIPKDERKNLENAAIAYSDAMIQYSRNIMEDMTSSMTLRPITDPSVQTFTERFSSVSGLVSAWKKLENQDEMQRKGFEILIKETPIDRRLKLLENKDYISLTVESNAQSIRDMVNELFVENK